jgi:predicted nucleic acid-binding Zn ribbon protein
MEAIVGLKTSCPICFSEKVNRKYAVPSIHFEGRGFYSTDNKRKENKVNKSDKE